MKKLLFVAFIAVAVFAALPASAATVYLKDGSQISGTIVSATAQDVRLHTLNGDVTLQSDQIRSVDYAGNEPQVVPTATQAPQPVAAEPPERVAVPQRYRREPMVERTDVGANDQLFSLGFGFATPLSRLSLSSTGGGSDDNGDTGILLGFQYHYFLSPRLAAGMDLEFLSRSRTGSENLLPNSETDVYGNTSLLLATLRYSLTTHGPVRPYILAGLGGNRTSTIVEAAPNPGFSWSDTDSAETRTLVDTSRWGLAETARVGLDFTLADPAIFSLEFGWTGISNSEYPATHAGQDLGLDHVTGNLSVFTLAARWGWRF
jgi:opacity protein-like surface antigen